MWSAEEGQLACLQYAHEHGCPWEQGACSEAAKNGHLVCLQFLHEHGCPWDWETIMWACEHRHWACADYAYQRGCRLDAEGRQCVVEELQSAGLIESVKEECPWLYDLCQPGNDGGSG
jgi:hypothetical protein